MLLIVTLLQLLLQLADLRTDLNLVLEEGGVADLSNPDWSWILLGRWVITHTTTVARFCRVLGSITI